MNKLQLFSVLIISLTQAATGHCDLAGALVFHVPFDDSVNARVAGGDALALTAANLDRNEITAGVPDHVSLAPSGGKFGGCLRFSDVSQKVLLFTGKGNIPYSSEAHSTTVSLWLKVDPKDGLKPGFVDPIQITDKKWNDASIFLDFTKDDSPRHFRLGVFSDFAYWNPDNKDFDGLPDSERPMVVEKQPPFSRDTWTHVAFTLTNINGDNSNCTLFIDGEKIGTLDRSQKLTWDLNKLVMMLGIAYIGDMDDLAIFNRELTIDEINHVKDVGVAAATGSSSLKQATINGIGDGWRTLTENDFVNVNCDKDTWTWKDGVAHCTGQPVGVIRSHEMIKNFELVCEWKHKKKGGNSGVFVWASQESIDQLAAGKGRLPHGIEVQVLDLGYAELYERGGKKADWFTSNGDVFPTGPAKMMPFAPVAPNGTRSFPSKNLTKGLNEWNHYYVRAINGEVRLWVNGEEVSGGTGCQPANGYLCLESEGAPVEFRNLRIRVLP